MKCAIYLAQSFPQPSGPQIIAFIGCGLALLAGYFLILRTQNEQAKKRQNEMGQPERRTLLPSPLLTKQVDDDYVTRSQMEATVKKAEAELEKKMVAHNDYVKTKFHKIDSDLNDIKLEAKDGREIATEQFQKIEGQLGELRSTSAHTNALAIRTDQAVRDIPEKIAAAVARNRR